MASVWLYNKKLKKWCKKNNLGLVDGDFSFDPKEPLKDPLIEVISQDININKEFIYSGAGINQFIPALICHTKWKDIFIPSIEFGLYERSGIISQKNIHYIDAITTAQFVKIIQTLNSTESSLLCFSSPRWVSGERFTLDQIKQICHAFKGNIFIDEAYVDFSDTPNQLLSLCMENSKIILARSFSKKYIASGIRAGYIITKTNIDGLRNTIIPPHSITTHTNKMLTHLISDIKLNKSFEETRKYICENRDYIYNKLKSIPNFKILKSSANFITILFNNSLILDKYYQKISNIVGVNKYEMGSQFFIKIWIKNFKFSELIVNQLLS